MLRKIVNSLVSSGKQVLGFGNQPDSNSTMQSHYQPGNQNYQQFTEYQIPPYLDPHINQNADWEYYRQLVAAREFVRNQYQQQQTQYQQQAMYSQVLDNMREQRTEWESQQLANGASPEYYRKLHQAYQRGINQKTNHHQ